MCVNVWNVESGIWNVCVWMSGMWGGQSQQSESNTLVCSFWIKHGCHIAQAIQRGVLPSWYSYSILHPLPSHSHNAILPAMYWVCHHSHCWISQGMTDYHVSLTFHQATRPLLPTPPRPLPHNSTHHNQSDRSLLYRAPSTRALGLTQTSQSLSQ